MNLISAALVLLVTAECRTLNMVTSTSTPHTYVTNYLDPDHPVTLRVFPVDSPPFDVCKGVTTEALCFKSVRHRLDHFTKPPPIPLFTPLPNIYANAITTPTPTQPTEPVETTSPTPDATIDPLIHSGKPLPPPQAARAKRDLSPNPFDLYNRLHWCRHPAAHSTCMSSAAKRALAFEAATASSPMPHQLWARHAYCNEHEHADDDPLCLDEPAYQFHVRDEPELKFLAERAAAAGILHPAPRDVEPLPAGLDIHDGTDHISNRDEDSEYWITGSEDRRETSFGDMVDVALWRSGPHIDPPRLDIWRRGEGHPYAGDDGPPDGEGQPGSPDWKNGVAEESGMSWAL